MAASIVITAPEWSMLRFFREFRKKTSEATGKNAFPRSMYVDESFYAIMFYEGAEDGNDKNRNYA
jgi:hypothetical protein